MGSKKDKKFQIYALSASKLLAEKIAESAGIELSSSTVTRFADGEIICEFEKGVRGCSTFVVQSTCTPDVNTNLMELLIMIDALKRADAKYITAVIPYFGYARQDRKAKPHQPITAKLVAKLLMAAGATRVMTMDLHAPQIQGFFDVQLDEYQALPVIAKYFKDKNLENLTIVSPDHGGAKRAKKMADLLGVPTAIVDKRRPRPNVSEVTGIIGDVAGRTCVLIDDMIDTGGSIVNAAKALIEKGAIEVYAACSHGILSPPAKERFESSLIKEVVIMDTIATAEDRVFDKLTVLSGAELFGKGIKAVVYDESLGDVFKSFEKEVLE